ncbi:MAG: exosortase-associated EpsI family protein [Caldilineaceae bacterium]|nr:exosortase-associated EpsI family protein [Caldilineaceae bacterium]
MFKRTSIVGIVIIGLLSIGILGVYSSQLAILAGRHPVLRAGDELTYVTDLDFWQRTPRERTVEAIAHFDLDHDLNDVPMQIGEWVGEDDPETNREVIILLEPEQYVQRLYHDRQGRYLWLTMIGGRSSQPFHAPDICYDADGWQYDLGSRPTRLDGGGEIYGLWLHGKKRFANESEPAEHVVYYFYLFPDEQRDQRDGIVLFKLTSGRYGSLESTLELHEAFTRAFFRAAGSAVDLAQAQ